MCVAVHGSEMPFMPTPIRSAWSRVDGRLPGTFDFGARCAKNQQET